MLQLSAAQQQTHTVVVSRTGDRGGTGTTQRLTAAGSACIALASPSFSKWNVTTFTMSSSSRIEIVLEEFQKRGFGWRRFAQG